MERKTTKSDSPYDPHPYTAVAVHGTQVVGSRGVERKVCDSQKWKRVEIRTAQKFSRSREEEREDPDIRLPATYGAGTGQEQGQGQAKGDRGGKEKDKQQKGRIGDRERSAGRSGASHHQDTGQRDPAGPSHGQCGQEAEGQRQGAAHG